MQKILILIITFTTLLAWGSDDDLSCTQMIIHTSQRVTSQPTVLLENKNYTIKVKAKSSDETFLEEGSDGTFLEEGTELAFDQILRDFQFQTVTEYTVPPGNLRKKAPIMQPFTKKDFLDLTCYKKNSGRNAWDWELESVPRNCVDLWNEIVSDLNEQTRSEVSQTKLVRFQNDKVLLTVECHSHQKCNIGQIGNILGIKKPFASIQATSRQSCSPDTVVNEESSGDTGIVE